MIRVQKHKRKQDNAGMALIAALIFITVSVIVLTSMTARYVQQRVNVDRFEDYYTCFDGVEAAVQQSKVAIETGNAGVIGLEDWAPQFSDDGRLLLPGFDDAGVTPGTFATMPGVEFVAYTIDWFGNGRDMNGDGVADSPAEMGMYSVHAAARTGGMVRQVEVVYASNNVNVWRNAIFAGAGQAGRLINGNVSIHGSVHLLGDHLPDGGLAIVGVEDPAVELSGASLISNNYVSMPDDLRQRIPALPTRDYQGDDVETLNANLRVKRGIVSMNGNARIGLNQVAGDTVKNPMDGVFVTDGWGGNLYRLVTEKYDGGVQKPSKPSQWAELLSTNSLTNPLPLIEVDEPITAGPAISWDGRNYWVYFGTGRLYNRQDFNDTSVFSYYGIKEPRAGNAFTWNTVIKQDAISDDGIAGSGEQGLLRVDQIEVRGSGESLLECLGGGTACLPTGVDRFQHLLNYIAGDGTKTGTDGWYRKFHDPGERNLGQATVLGGLLTFSSYLPSTDPCALEGFSELYALYYQTGTAWRRPVFIRDGESDEFVEYRLRIGPGLAITPSLHVGTESGATVFLQTSTGAIVSLEQPELPFTDYKAGREWWREIYREMFQ